MVWHKVVALGAALLVASSASGQEDLDFDFLLENEASPAQGNAEDAQRSAGPPVGDGADATEPSGPDQGPDKTGIAAEEDHSPTPSGQGDSPRLPKAARSRVIEEIIVTAQKTEQSLQDVPISVSAIGGELIKEAAITDAAALVQYTPNIKLGASNPQFTTVSIRGFGTPPLARGIEPSVGLVIDDAFYGRSTFVNDGVFDVERVEVLRGPQGTLFGKNTIAGLMNFTTAEPSFEPAGYLALAGASLDGRRVDGAFGGPLVGDVLAGRIAFRVQDADTGVYNTTRRSADTIKNQQARIKLKWLLSDSLDLKLTAMQSSFDMDGNGMQYSHLTAKNRPFFEQADPNLEDDEFNGKSQTDAPSFSKRNSESTTLSLTKALDVPMIDGLEMSIIANTSEISTPFLIDSDFSPIDFSFVDTDGPEVYKQKSLELRFTGTTAGAFSWGKSMDWVAGMSMYDTRFDVTQFSHQNLNALPDVLPIILQGRLPPGAQPLEEALIASGVSPVAARILANGGVLPPGQADTVVLNALSSSGRAKAVYAQTTWHLTDRLATVLGLRLGKEDRQGRSSSENFGFLLAPILVGQQNYQFSGKRSENEVSPKLALTYELKDGVSLFGNITRGYKSGGFSGPLLAPRNLEYDPERALSTELGAKTRLLDDSLVLNVALYQVKFDDLQLNLFDGTSLSTINAASAVSKGLEVDFQWLPPIEFLSLQGSFGVTDAKYGSFPCGPPRYNDGRQDGCGEDNPLTPMDERPPSQDLTGRELAFVPKYSASLTPMVKLPIWPSRNIGGFAALDVLYQHEHYLDYDLDPQTLQKSTTKLNARVGMRPLDGAWSVVFNAKNLTNQKEKILVLDAQQSDGDFSAIVNPDETQYSLELRYNFGQ